MEILLLFLKSVQTNVCLTILSKFQNGITQCSNCGKSNRLQYNVNLYPSVVKDQWNEITTLKYALIHSTKFWAPKMSKKKEGRTRISPYQNIFKSWLKCSTAHTG